MSFKEQKGPKIQILNHLKHLILAINCELWDCITFLFQTSYLVYFQAKKYSTETEALSKKWTYSNVLSLWPSSWAAYRHNLAERFTTDKARLYLARLHLASLHYASLYIASRGQHIDITFPNDLLLIRLGSTWLGSTWLVSTMFASTWLVYTWVVSSILVSTCLVSTWQVSTWLVSTWLWST